MTNIELVQQVIIATRNATLAYHNYMYTDREYVKGQKLYLREMHFLVFVGDSKELTMSEIAEKMNVTQGAATQIAGRLLKKGLIQKQKQASDKRYSVITLTPEGLQVYQEYLIYNQKRYAEIAAYLEDYTEEDMELILKYENLIQKICVDKAPLP